jgi:hypothetical protein
LKEKLCTVKLVEATLTDDMGRNTVVWKKKKKKEWLTVGYWEGNLKVPTIKWYENTCPYLWAIMKVVSPWSELYSSKCIQLKKIIKGVLWWGMLRNWNKKNKTTPKEVDNNK